MLINELKFETHPIGAGGARAVAEFDNGYKASVVTGEMFRSRSDAPYEVAVLDEDGITYDTPVTDDVLGYLTEDEANDVLAAIEALPAL